MSALAAEPLPATQSRDRDLSTANDPWALAVLLNQLTTLPQIRVRGGAATA